MSAVQIQGNAAGTGTLTIAAPNTNTNQTLTLPDNTGTLLSTGSTFAGTGPAFSAYANGTTTLSNSNFTKVLLATEVFDTNSNFASSRFTPTVAGYYQIEGTVGVDLTATASSVTLSSLFFNGSRYRDGSLSSINNAQGGWSTVSSVIYCNGSTDYVELYVYFAVGQIMGTTNQQVFMSGAMVRSA